MKKILYLRAMCLLLILLSVFSLCLPASASSYYDSLPDTSLARNVYFANEDSGTVILNKDPNSRIAPASTVKILTGLIAIEKFKDTPNTEITVSAHVNNAQGASMGLAPNDKIKAIDLIYAVICGGYNDAAYAIACAISGTPSEFVKLMNKKLGELGAQNTNYTNPSGMDDPEMYTTLSDTVKLVRSAADNEAYVDISSAVARKITYSRGGETVESTANNRNALISGYYAEGYTNPSAMGLIAGMTDTGGYCVATKAKISGSSYICVVMGARESGDTIGSFATANALIQYARSSLGLTKVMNAGEIICHLPIDFALVKSDERVEEISVPVCVEKDVFLFLPKNADIDEEISYKYYLYDERLEAPVFSGDRIGGIDFFYNGKLIGTTPLIITDDVTANEFLLNMSEFKDRIFSRTTFISLVLFISLFSFYILIDNHISRKRSKKIFKVTIDKKL